MVRARAAMALQPLAVGRHCRNMKCPKCGHVFKAENQAKGGKARWRGMTKGQRRKAASAAAKARWARRQNKDSATPVA